MAKAGKSTISECRTGVAQKHLHSRISFLYQASVYLNNFGLHAEPDSQNAGLPRPGLTKEQADPAQRLEGHGTSTDAAESKRETEESRLDTLRGLEAKRWSSPQTRHLLALMRSISQKSQIRLSHSIKRSICRRCNGLLILNSTAEIENLSRGGRKPCADVLVVRCCQCGFVKRYPIGMGEAHKRKPKQSLTDGVIKPKGNANDAKQTIEA